MGPQIKKKKKIKHPQTLTADTEKDVKWAIRDECNGVLCVNKNSAEIMPLDMSVDIYCRHKEMRNMSTKRWMQLGAKKKMAKIKQPLTKINAIDVKTKHQGFNNHHSIPLDVYLKTQDMKSKYKQRINLK